MVYRGKPSAGCDACRKAKKRCDLEQPACARCVKLKKECSGYRDTTQLQVYDESEAVRRKANRQKLSASGPCNSRLAVSRPATGSLITPAATPRTSQSESSIDSGDILDQSCKVFGDDEFDDIIAPGLAGRSLALVPVPGTTPNISIAGTMKPTFGDVATTHFFNQFTANGHWEFLRLSVSQGKLEPCLDYAVRACGMAALTNVEHVERGREYAQSMYVDALSHLNLALRDQKRSKTDESLIAVAMMGYYENLVCEDQSSIQSWKAHIDGATQLLKLRGTEQFKTPSGRMLFRETRAQILIHSIWDDFAPPHFLWDWQDELKKHSVIEGHLIQPVDDLFKISFDYARVRAKVENKQISHEEALSHCNDVDRRMLQWSVDTMALGGRWRYEEIEVPESPHVWNGLMHQYEIYPSPAVWNTYRSMRILVSRTQEWLCSRFTLSPAERAAQTMYFRKVRREMTDEICAGIPASLGHGKPGKNSPAILTSAYASIWPLFFAGTCALERMGYNSWDAFTKADTDPMLQSGSAITAQAKWITGRLEYISKVVGLRWAGGIAAALRGDFTTHEHLRAEDVGETVVQSVVQSGDATSK